MILRDWIREQTTSDTHELYKLATTRPSVSVTPQPSIHVPREAYSHEVIIRDIVQARYGPLSDYAGLTDKERFDLLRSRLAAAFTSGPTQADKNQALFDATTIKAVNDIAKEEDGGMSHADFLTATIELPQADVIDYGKSPVEEYGTDSSWDNLSGDTIEAAQR